MSTAARYVDAAADDIVIAAEPRQLYTMNEIAVMFNVTKVWVGKQVTRHGAPPADFCCKTAGGRMKPLWTAVSLDRWRAYYASTDSVAKRVTEYTAYSDHKAVNEIGPMTITWKLWWRCLSDGGTMWWFSTPHGWYASINDGRTWQFTDVMLRPGDYRYFCVNGSVTPGPNIARILRSAEKLRIALEAT